MKHPFRNALLSLCAWMPLALSAGCASEGEAQAGADEAPSAGLDALERDNARPAKVDLNDKSAAGTRNMIDLMAAAQSNADVDVSAPSRRVPPAKAPAMVAAEPPAEADGGDDPVANEPVAEVGPVEETKPAGDQKAALVAELAELLRARAKDASDPTSPLLQLAALELLGAPEGSLPAEPDAKALERLSPREREFVTAWRKLLAGAGATMADSKDVAGLAQKVSELATGMSAFEPLATSNAVLARSVDGFGMFSELPRSAGGAYQFLAGRAARAVVYIEVTGHTFTEKKQGGVDGFQVALSQELRLYHSSKDEDLLAWQRPAANITDFSRNRRREFFITQVIDLPATLTVGGYRLKVRVTDRAADASAEAVIPIEVLADVSAMAGEKP
jgi:hypothetical protein